jgi:uncharacterized protein (UPF0333 family)
MRKRQWHENPIAERTLWLLGLGGVGIAVGVGVWALTGSSAAGTGAGSSSATLNAAAAALSTTDQTALCNDNNPTVVAFQNAWNAQNPTQAITVDGRYGSTTASAAQQINSSAPAACSQWG